MSTNWIALARAEFLQTPGSPPDETAETGGSVSFGSNSLAYSQNFQGDCEERTAIMFSLPLSGFTQRDVGAREGFSPPPRTGARINPVKGIFTVQKEEKMESDNKNTCGAKTRSGTLCQRKDLLKGRRCRLHGGLSTGPKTLEGKRRSALNTGKTYEELVALRADCTGR